MKVNGWIAATVSGALLALMIFINSFFSSHTSIVWSSLVVHIVGALVALLLCLMLREPILLKIKVPLWTYSGGIFGAFIVIIANFTVDSSIGTSGSISLMILGQVLFSMLSDHFAWFGIKKRLLSMVDLFQVVLILSGTGIIVFFAR